MNISTSVDGDIVTLQVAGELDILSVGQVFPVLDQLLRGPQRRWRLDLSQLRMLDSSGVGAIIYAFRKLRERHGVMTIDGATDQPLSVLRLMRLDKVIERSASESVE
jgi:anti-sigma B factor antagonist